MQIPVSIKTRLGWDETHKDWLDLVSVAAQSGAAFVALHGRTRAQGYTGQSQLPQISNLPLPIIANGDLTNIADIERVEKLGYSGAMLGRAMLGKPWIFGQICQNIDAPQNVGEIVLKHLDLMIDYYGAKVGIPMFRKHVMWYSAGMPNSAQFRIKINQILDEGDLKKNIKEFWHVN